MTTRYKPNVELIRHYMALNHIKRITRLARVAGVSQSTLYKIKNHNTYVTLPVATEIAKALKCQTLELFERVTK